MTTPTLAQLLEIRRALQFRYANSAWQSGPDYRAKIAEIDAQIAREQRSAAA